MATLKKAKRILKRVNGKLTTVYVDAETGQELTSLDGYELATQDGFSQGYGPATSAPATPEETPVATPTKNNDPKADFWTSSDWATSPTRSKGTGDILGDFMAAGNTLNQRMNDLKSYIGDGIMNTVGKVGAALIPADKRNAAVQGAADSAKTAAVNAATSVADKVTGALGGFFGGGSTPATGAPVSPNEMFTYRDIETRNLPLSASYMDTVAAATASVNPNIRWEISSAGQAHDYDPKTNPVGGTGSTRHNVDEHGEGHTADIHPTLDGKKIDYNTNPEVYEQLVSAMAAVGFTGIGVDMSKGYLHVGGGTPAVWTYDGARSIPAPANIQSAYNKGVELNKAGEGEVIKQAYADQVYGSNKSATKLAQAPQTNPTISPDLRDAVTSYKSAKGQTVVNPTTVSQPLQAIPQSPINEAFSYTPPKTAPIVQQPQPVAQVPQQTATQAIEAFAPQPARVDTGQMSGFMPVNTPTPAAPSTLMSNLLSAINYAEGSPSANTLFGGNTFDDDTRHPNEKVYYNGGADFSTAAGKYQINKDTFNDYAGRLGINSFTEDDQTALATAIAQDRYKAKTGGDLETDLQNPDNLEDIFKALSGTWSSLPAGVQARTKFDELKDFFDYGDQNTPTAPVGSKELVRPASNFMGSEPTSLQSVTKPSAFMPSDDPKTVAKQAASKAESKASGLSGVTSSGSSTAAKAAEKAASKAASTPVSSGSSSSGSRATGLSGVTSAPRSTSSSGSTTSGGFMSGTSSSNKVKTSSTPSASTSSTSTGGRSTSGTTTQTSSTKDKSTSSSSSSSSKEKSKTK